MRLCDAVKEAADRESDEAEHGHQKHRGQEAGPRPGRDQQDQCNRRRCSAEGEAGRCFEALVHCGGDAWNEPVCHGDHRADEPEGPTGNANQAVVLAVERGKISCDRIDEQSADQHDCDALGRERVGRSADGETQGRATAAACVIGWFCGFLKAQRDPQAADRLQ